MPAAKTAASKHHPTDILLDINHFYGVVLANLQMWSGSEQGKISGFGN